MLFSIKIFQVMSYSSFIVHQSYSCVETGYRCVISDEQCICNVGLIGDFATSQDQDSHYAQRITGVFIKVGN